MKLTEFYEPPPHELTLLQQQLLYSKFVEQFNRSTTEADLEAFHQAREIGLFLNSAVNFPEAQTSFVAAMLEQLNWFPEFCGDIEAGEQIKSLGYPDNYIFQGDATELIQYIPDESINLIFTDPPYLKDSMYIYRWLAEQAARVLTPDGFLLTYVGNYWKEDAMMLMRNYLSYFWDYTIIHSGNSPVQRNRRTRSTTKSILCYTKKASRALPRIEVQASFKGSGPSKQYHPWGQSVDEAQYYISCFSKPGDTILDPFMGGGTTAVACLQSSRAWIGFEINSKYAQIGQGRVYSDS